MARRIATLVASAVAVTALGLTVLLLGVLSAVVVAVGVVVTLKMLGHRAALVFTAFAIVAAIAPFALPSRCGDGPISVSGGSNRATVIECPGEFR